eukprot:5914328-Amphidinium_carterae.1
MENVVKLFKQHDVNGDGSLSCTELTKVLEKLGLKVEDLEQLFSAADLNGDGYIDIDEFVGFLSGQPAKQPPADDSELEEDDEEDSDDEVADEKDPPDEVDASDDEGV